MLDAKYYLIEKWCDTNEEKQLFLSGKKTQIFQLLAQSGWATFKLEITPVTPRLLQLLRLGVEWLPPLP